MLKIFKKENSSTYVFTKSMGYVNRTINNILRKTTLLIKKTTDVGGDADQSHTAKNLNFQHFGYREIKSPRNRLEAGKRET